MIEFDSWRRHSPFPAGKDWLILGKGPTFSRRGEFDLTGFVTMSLNHVVAEQQVDVAHMIDFEVAEKCAEAIRDKAQWLLMPRHPHLAFRPTLLRLDELIRHSPVLSDLEAQGRIITYDLANSPEPPRGTTVEARYFSSEAALDLVGHLGASTVRTLGVDGGTAYAGAFSALDATTRLANGQPSFSVQFGRLQLVAARHGLSFEPLVAPLKVFVGVHERELIAARVLEYTINEFATQPVQVVHLPVVTRKPHDPAKQQRTPFSFSRFLIPELCGFRGRALYVDSDMQVFDDITKLWDIPFRGATVMCTNQTFVPPQWRDNPEFHPGRQQSVMMLDCQALPWKIDEIIDRLDHDDLTYEQLMFEMALVPPEEVSDDLPEGWNHLEHFIKGQTSLLHYTAIPTQPWKSEANPNGALWEAAFVRACRAGYIDVELVESQAKAGHVRSSLARLVPSLEVKQPAPTSAIIAELDATRDALARRGGPFSRATRRVARRAERLVRSNRLGALDYIRQARSWAARMRVQRGRSTQR